METTIDGTKTLRDAKREFGAKYGVGSPLMEQFVEREKVERKFRKQLQGVLRNGVMRALFPWSAPKPELRLMVRWASCTVAKMRDFEAGSLVYSWIDLLLATRDGFLPENECCDQTAVITMLLAEFNERRDEIAAKIDQWEHEAANLLSIDPLFRNKFVLDRAVGLPGCR